MFSGFVQRDSPIWEMMWESLGLAIKEHGLGDGKDLEQWNERYGEAWQYMGSSNGKHQFRHRAHPNKNDQRILMEVEVAHT